MKIFIYIFILLIALSTLSYAGKLQLEGPQFDLSATSTTTCKTGYYIHGTIQREMGWSYGGFDIPISGAKVTLDDLNSNFSDTTETNSDGYFKFCSIEDSDYLVTASKKGYDTAKYRLTVLHQNDVSYYTRGEDTSMNLYKKGTSPEKNSEIEFSLIHDPIWEEVKNIKVSLKGMQTKYKTNFTADTDLVFEFDDLKADTYLLTAKKGRKTKTKRIKLEKNMIYQCYINW